MAGGGEGGEGGGGCSWKKSNLESAVTVGGPRVGVGMAKRMGFLVEHVELGHSHPGEFLRVVVRANERDVMERD